MGQCRAILWKQRRSYWRNTPYTVVRFLFTTFLGIIFGTMFWDLGSKRRTQQDLIKPNGFYLSGHHLPRTPKFSVGATSHRYRANCILPRKSCWVVFCTAICLCSGSSRNTLRIRASCGIRSCGLHYDWVRDDGCKVLLVLILHIRVFNVHDLIRNDGSRYDTRCQHWVYSCSCFLWGLESLFRIRYSTTRKFKHTSH